MVMAQIWKRGNIVKAVIDVITQFTLLPKLLTNNYILQSNILF